jgi:hypothetical protein
MGEKTDVWQGTLLGSRPRSHARAQAAHWACGLLFVDAPSRVDRTKAPDSVLAIRHAALGARRRPHAGGRGCHG